MYLVTAYRWGWLNGHQYQVYCGPDHTKALALAQNETEDRGGKYGCAVYEWNEDGTDYKRVAYFGASMEHETEPFHNWRIDYFERLGHTLDEYANGKVWGPTGEGTTLKREDIEPPPQCILNEVQRAKEFCAAMFKAQDERRAVRNALRAPDNG